MGLDSDGMLKEAGAVMTTGTTCYAVRTVKDLPMQTHLGLPGNVALVDRDRWLDILLKDIPKDRLHSSKKLKSIEQPSGTGPCVLHFEDGTSHEADLVIGADGTRSKVREIVLGPEQQDKWAAEFGVYWDARGRMSPKDATERFGSELIDPTAPQQKGVVGNGAFLLFGPTSDGEIMHIIVSAVAGPNFDKTAWKTQLSKEFLEESYRDWTEYFRRGIIDSMMADDSGPGMVFSQWQMPDAPTYCRDRVCIMGDAAHAPTPWMGQGAAQSIEDAAVLAILLRAVKSAEDKHLRAVMRAFDEVRRGKPKYVVRKSQEAGKLLTGQPSLDPAVTAKFNAPEWFEKVERIDMEAHVRDAVACYHRLMQADMHDASAGCKSKSAIIQRMNIYHTTSQRAVSAP